MHILSIFEMHILRVAQVQSLPRAQVGLCCKHMLCLYPDIMPRRHNASAMRKITPRYSLKYTKGAYAMA